MYGVHAAGCVPTYVHVTVSNVQSPDARDLDMYTCKYDSMTAFLSEQFACMVNNPSFFNRHYFD